MGAPGHAPMPRFTVFLVLLGLISASQRGRGGYNPHRERTKMTIKNEVNHVHPNDLVKTKRPVRQPRKAGALKDDLTMWPVYQDRVKEVQTRPSRRAVTEQTKNVVRDAEHDDPSRFQRYRFPTGDNWIDAIHGIPVPNSDLTADERILFDLFPPQDYDSHFYSSEDLDMPVDYFDTH